MKIPSILFTLLLILSCVPGHASDPAKISTVPPDAALELLRKGNARCMAAEENAPRDHAGSRAKTASGQTPFAIIVGCSDSRLSPEIIFDQTHGSLFVVRTAGNLVDNYGLGSIEYAVEHLGSRLIVVLGHQQCGAVKAAVAGGEAPGHIADLVRSITPAVKIARGQKGDLLENSIRDNVRLMEEKIRHHAKLGSLAKEVKVVGAEYDLSSGKVTWLD